MGLSKSKFQAKNSNCSYYDVQYFGGSIGAFLNDEQKKKFEMNHGNILTPSSSYNEFGAEPGQFVVTYGLLQDIDDCRLDILCMKISNSYEEILDFINVNRNKYDFM